MSLLLFWNGTGEVSPVDIEYTEVVSFTVELAKVMPLTVECYKTASASVELAKVMSLTAYAELEDNA